jgi:hypothetical protein
VIRPARPSSAKGVGRTIGALMLVQIVTAPVVNFALLRSVTRPPGFLASAAASALEVRLAALLLVVAGVLTVAVAAVALPIFRRHSERMAFGLLALGAVNLSTVVAESVGLLTMVSLSQEYARAGAPDDLFRAAAVIVRSARNWAHFVNLLVAGGGVLVLYGILYRFALVPRVLAAFGLAAGLLQIAGVTMPLLGYPMVFAMLAPLGLSHLILMLWLLAKGLAERAPDLATS